MTANDETNCVPVQCDSLTPPHARPGRPSRDVRARPYDADTDALVTPTTSTTQAAATMSERGSGPVPTAEPGSPSAAVRTSPVKVGPVVPVSRTR